jgi:dihydroneopterin aldolase
MDKLRLKGLVFYAHHGCTEEERTLGGRYEVDCELWMDLRKPGRTDDLKWSVDARALYDRIEPVVVGSRFRTVEGLAEAISKEILQHYSLKKVIVRVRKPNPPSVGTVDHLEVEVERSA